MLFRSNLWGGVNTNKRGEFVEEFIINNNTVKLDNIGNTPTFNRENAQTIIDLTMSSINMEVLGWRVHEGGLSDHNLITYTVKLDSRRVVKARNHKQVEWHKFRRILDSQPCQRHTSTIWSTKRLEEEVKALEGRIIATLDEEIGRAHV